jgi:acyl-coenzyme A thioesterase 13
MTDPTPSSAPVSVASHVEQVWATKITTSQPYNILIPDIKLVSATSDGRVIGQLVLEDKHVNSLGGIHGTTSAAIVDFTAGMSIVAKSGGQKTGVSTDIHISYVASAKVGDTVEVECWLNKLGRNLAYTSMEIRKVVKAGEDKKVLVTGSHTKYVA